MWFKGHIKAEGKLAVISGASQGLGAEIAKQLFEKGASVYLVARNETNLKEKVKEIEKVRVNETQIVDYVRADLTKYSDASNVFEVIGKSPDIVMCCAGSSKPGYFLKMTEKDLEGGVNINYNTAMNFAHCALKKMCTSDKTLQEELRHLVFFSSVVGFYPFIGYSQYAPMKTAVKTLSDVLRQECLPYNINVDCVFPGNFESEGFIEEELTKPKITKEIEGPSDAISASACAKIVIDQLDQGYQYVTTDLIGWILSCLSLGYSPRCLGLPQLFFAIILSTFGGFLQAYYNYSIRSFFKTTPLPHEISDIAEDDKAK